jgi:hypothetical protein
MYIVQKHIYQHRKRSRKPPINSWHLSIQEMNVFRSCREPFRLQQIGTHVMGYSTASVAFLVLFEGCLSVNNDAQPTADHFVKLLYWFATIRKAIWIWETRP